MVSIILRKDFQNLLTRSVFSGIIYSLRNHSVKMRLSSKLHFYTMKPKSPSRKTWTFSFVPQAQHHLTEGQHHFERSENIIPHEAAQMSEVAASRK